MSNRIAAMCLLAAAILAGSPSLLRSQVKAGGFTPGGQVLFATNFAQDPVGSFPQSLQFVKGPMEVVTVNGVPMLRAIGPAEFLINLSQPLPQDFTLEFDFIPRTGAGHQIAFEGGPVASRSVSSAEVLWNFQITTIMGGGQGMAQVTLPYDLQTQLVGQRSTVQVMVSGTQFKLFTNGRQFYNIPNLAFRRATALRIYLGGVDDNQQAVYVAGIRLATSGATAIAAAPPTATTTPMPSGTPSTPNPPPAPGAPGAATGTPRTGTIVGGGPTTKPPLTVVPPPPSISTAPAPYNQPVQLLPSQNSLAQTGQQTASGAPFVAGPSQLFATAWPPPPDFFSNGYAIAVFWDPVPGASGYRVYLTVAGSPFPAQPHLTLSEAEAAAIASDHGAPNYRMVIDPYLRAANIYWVDAILSNGTMSGLSPSSTYLPISANAVAGKSFGLVANLKASIGPTITTLMPDGVTSAPGRTVAWTWDPLPAGILYHVSLEYAASGSIAQFPVYVETLLASQTPTISGITGTPTPLASVLVPLNNLGHRKGPPFLRAVPSGMIVRFCVSIYRDPSTPNAPLSQSTSTCQVTPVP